MVERAADDAPFWQPAPSELFDMMVALYVRGDFFDPAHMASVTDLVPETAWPKGFVRVSPSGRQSTAKDGVWVYSVSLDGTTIEAGVRKLLADLGSRVGEATTLSGVESVSIDVCAQRSEAAQQGVSTAYAFLPRQLIGEIAALGFDLQITLYTSWDDTEATSDG